ncbi:MAG TPA: OmpA family protein [Burkholderiaceae bacterium]|nr:OmpA family protein [Burkholderiaceae bacterium]
MSDTTTASSALRRPESPRLPGEDAPAWLALAFGAIGLLCAAAAGWLWAGGPAVPVEPRAPSAALAPAAVVPPVPPSAPPPSVARVTAPVTAPDACLPPSAVLFDFGGTTIDARSGPSPLADLVAWLSAHPDAKIELKGHADSIGDDQSNLLLSYRRAMTVAAMLRQAGVAGPRIVVNAAGSHEPLDGIPDTDGANRRVILRVKGAEGCPRD